MHDDNPQENSEPRVRRAWHVRCLVILIIGSVSLLAAACGGGSSSSDVASIGSTTTTTAPASALPAGSSGTSTAGALLYAKCMRSHGFSDFPDPNAEGGFDDLPGNISPNSAQYVAANKVCQPLVGTGHHFSQAQQEQIESRALAFAQCMRSHGVPDYPDPTISFSDGGVSETAGSPSGALHANSPQFQSAQKACQRLRGGSGL